jgi:hypothetical protein
MHLSVASAPVVWCRRRAALRSDRMRVVDICDGMGGERSNPIANPAAVLQEEPGGGAWLLNPDSAGALALNPTGIVVWKLINGRRGVSNIAAAVRRHFIDAPESVESDVSALLEVLTEEGFVGYEYRGDGHERGSTLILPLPDPGWWDAVSHLKRYHVNPVVSCRDEGADGAILFNPDRDETMVINAPGRALWQLLSAPHTAEDLAARLVEAYSDVEMEQAQIDVEAFLKPLVGDFVQEVDGGNGD